MEIETILVVLGVFFLGIATVGGGIEFYRLKIPMIGFYNRLFVFVVGFALIISGIFAAKLDNNKNSDNSGTTVEQGLTNSQAFVTEFSNFKVEQARLKAEMEAKVVAAEQARFKAEMEARIAREARLKAEDKARYAEEQRIASERGRGENQQAEMAAQRRTLLQMSKKDMEPIFSGFMEAWNNKQYRRQMSYLSSDFYYVDKRKVQNYDEYVADKKKFFRKYSWISVTVSNISYSFNGNEGSVTYYQHYNSPYYESKGTNKFYFRKRWGETKIFKEEFERDWYRVKK
jgi:hypothetical protein